MISSKITIWVLLIISIIVFVYLIAPKTECMINMMSIALVLFYIFIIIWLVMELISLYN